jgi:hypothetical protein
MIIIKRGKGYADKMRAYKVLLDGTEIGNIRQGESKQFPVQEGKYTLQLKIDWCTSEPITFDLADKPITFECGSNTAMKAAFSAFFKTKNYMWLKRVE